MDESGLDGNRTSLVTGVSDNSVEPRIYELLARFSKMKMQFLGHSLFIDVREVCST